MNRKLSETPAGWPNDVTADFNIATFCLLQQRRLPLREKANNAINGVTAYRDDGEPLL
jgi:hypothetical protein